MKFKIPFLKPRRRQPPPRTGTLNARVSRNAESLLNDYDREEPSTPLSFAFVVVLLLHVVAIGGIYAFNSMKARENGREATIAADKAELARESGETMAQDPAAAGATPHPAIATATASTAQRTHKVRAGETFAKIGASYGISGADLAAANMLKESTTLHADQVLVIPSARATPKAVTGDHKADFLAKKTDEAAKAPAASPAASASKTYVVAKGDTPYSIAHKLGVSQTELAKLNKIDDPKKIQPGQILKVPGKTPTP